MTTLSNESNLYVGMLNDRLLGLRRRLVGFGLGAAGTWGGGATFVMLLVFAGIDLAVELPGGIRLTCLLTAFIAGLIVTVKLSLLVLRAQESGSVARRLDKLADSRGQISTAVDLAATSHANPITAGLAQLAVRRALEIASGVSPVLAVPGKSLMRPISGFIGLLFLVAVIALISPRMVGTQFLRFVDPFGDHPPYSRITFSIDPGNAKVIYGGSVDIAATVNDGVVERMELLLTANNEALPMFPEGGGKWRATVAGITSPANYLIRSGRIRSKKFSIEVITIPNLKDVKFRVQLPEYTNRAPYEGPVPQNGLSGLPGTSVEIHAKSNRPLSGGQIVITPIRYATTAPAAEPTVIAMVPVNPGDSEVVGRFQIQTAGMLTLGVTDIDGQASSQKLTTSITLLKDEKPFVRLLSPRPESFATPDATLKVEALAEDDYGISAVSIFQGLNGSTLQPTQLPVPAPPLAQVSATMMMSLADHGVKPGDTLQLFAHALDADPSGAKGADSSIVTLHIVSQADMDRMMATQAGMEMLQNKYAAAERRLEAADAQLEKLEKQLNKADPDSKVSSDIRDQLAAAAAQMSKAAGDIDKLALHPLPFDIDHALEQQLKDSARAIAAAGAEAKYASTQPSLASAGALDQVKKIRKDLGVKKDAFAQNATAPLEYLSKIFPLIEDQARFLDLYSREKDLAARLKSIQSQNGGDDPKVKTQMRDFEDEQRAIRDDLSKLLDDIDSHVAQLPADPKLDDLRKTAKDFVSAVRPSPANYEMQTTESSLEDFQGTPAESFASAAEQTLSGFIGRCQSMGNQGQTCLKFQPKLSAGLGDTVDQMLNSMSLSTGLGAAGMGGYSASRNSLANVGLYGTIPMHGEESNGHGGDADHGIATDEHGSPDGSDNPTGAGVGGKQHASGQSDAPVPAQYKKRVGEYFQRVADELSQ